MRGFAVMLKVCLIIGAGGSGGTLAAASIEGSAQQPGCDEVPTGVATENYWLRFKVPPGLMPDKQFDRRQARLQCIGFGRCMRTTSAQRCPLKRRCSSTVGFSVVRRLVLRRRSGLSTLFEGVIHLLKPLLRVRFALDETNTVVLQRLDREGVLTIEHTRHQ